MCGSRRGEKFLKAVWKTDLKEKLLKCFFVYSLLLCMKWLLTCTWIEKYLCNNYSCPQNIRHDCLGRIYFLLSYQLPWKPSHHVKTQWVWICCEGRKTPTGSVDICLQTENWLRSKNHFTERLFIKETRWCRTKYCDSTACAGTNECVKLIFW